MVTQNRVREKRLAQTQPILEKGFLSYFKVVECGDQRIDYLIAYLREYPSEKNIVIRSWKNWWNDHPEEIIEDIYSLLKKGKQGIELLRLLDEKSENHQVFERICHSLLDLYAGLQLDTDREGRNIANYLESVVQSFEDSQKVIPHATEGAVLYKYMLQVARYPIWHIPFPEMPPASMPYFQSLAKLLRRNFDLQLPVWDGIDAWNPLERIEELSINELDQIIISKVGAIRKNAAKKAFADWRMRKGLEREYQGDRGVVLSLSPQIILSEEHSETETDLPLLIENLGDQLIWDVQLEIKNASEKEYEILGDNTDNTFNLGYLHPGEYITRNVGITVSKSAWIQITLRYSCPFGKQLELSNRYRLLRGDESLREKMLLNPYLPDRPLRYKREITDFGNLPSRRKIVEIIKDEIVERKSQGLWINLYGMRRIGKTSILYHLESELAKLRIPLDNKKLRLVPVYIDCFGLNIRKRWDEKQVFHFIARKVRYEVMERFPKAFKTFPLFPSEEDPSLAFKKFVTQIYRQVSAGKQQGIRLVIMLDEVHVLDTPPFKPFALHLLRELQELTRGKENECPFSLILATERAMNEIWPELGKHDGETIGIEGKLSPLKERLPFLPLFSMAKDEIKEIATKVKLEYSDLALEYLWRVTGGYPSLVQVILYHVVKDRKEKKKSAVTMPVIRNVVQNLIKNQDYNDYFEYLKKGFTQSEWTMLNNIISKLDGLTMRIQMEEKEEERQILHSLATKQIIEEHMRIRKLRVGFFKLWIEAQH